MSSASTWGEAGTQSSFSRHRGFRGLAAWVFFVSQWIWPHDQISSEIHLKYHLRSMIYTYMVHFAENEKKDRSKLPNQLFIMIIIFWWGSLGWIGHISLYITFARGSCRALTQKILQREARKAQGLAGDRKIPMNTVVERPRNSNFFWGEEDFWCCIVWQATRGYSKVLLISSILVHFSELQAILLSGTTKCQPQHFGESRFGGIPFAINCSLNITAFW